MFFFLFNDKFLGQRWSLFDGFKAAQDSFRSSREPLPRGH